MQFYLNMSMKIQFRDFWGGYKAESNWFTEQLDKYGHTYVIVNDNPNVIIFSVFGNYQFQPKIKGCKNVYFTGENRRLVKDADLNLTFDNTSEHNNIRLPLWILYGYDKNMQLTKKNTNNFCCFVYSNNIQHRNNFCLKLSKYKNIYCGGRCLNNIGGRIKDKIEFQKQFKFCIAYENSLYPGYTTEKILEAYKSNCVPIYYGSTTVVDDFNPETFINAHDFESEEKLIEYIIKVDNDDSLYEKYLNKPIFSDKWLKIFNDPDEKYFKNICKEIIS